MVLILKLLSNYIKRVFSVVSKKKKEGRRKKGEEKLFDYFRCFFRQFFISPVTNTCLAEFFGYFFVRLLCSRIFIFYFVIFHKSSHIHMSGRIRRLFFRKTTL